MVMISHLFFAQTASNTASGVFFGLGFFALALVALYGVVWLYAVINAATRADLTAPEKLVWLLLLFFLPFIGMVLYFVLKGRGR